MAVLLAVGFLLAGGLLLAFDSLAVRHSGLGHSQHCLHSLITGPARQARVLIVGSSRMRQAVDPSRLAALWGLPESAVVSLAHPGRSFRLDADWIESLAKAGQVELVIMEAQVGSAATQALERRLDPARLEREDLQLASGRYREFYAVAASYRGLLRSVTDSAQGPLLAAYDLSRLLLRKLDRSIKLLATRQVFRTLNRPDPAIDYSRENICFLRAGSNPTLQQGTPQQQQKKRDFEAAFRATNPQGWAAAPADRGDFLDDPARAAARRSFARLSTLAKQRGFDLAFVYLPSIFVPPPDVRFAQTFERRLGAPLVLPTPVLLADLQVDGYYDNAHLNLSGIGRFTDWLAGEIEVLGHYPHGG